MGATESKSPAAQAEPETLASPNELAQEAVPSRDEPLPRKGMDDLSSEPYVTDADRVVGDYWDLGSAIGVYVVRVRTRIAARTASPGKGRAIPCPCGAAAVRQLGAPRCSTSPTDTFLSAPAPSPPQRMLCSCARGRQQVDGRAGSMQGY